MVRQGGLIIRGDTIMGRYESPLPKMKVVADEGSWMTRIWFEVDVFCRESEVGEDSVEGAIEYAKALIGAGKCERV